jgi:hypothetical protein
MARALSHGLGLAEYWLDLPPLSFSSSKTYIYPF